MPLERASMVMIFRSNPTDSAGAADVRACPGPLHWTIAGPCCPPHGRAHLWRRARALNWPRVRLAPLPIVVGGEAVWRKWLLRAGPVDLGLTHRQLSVLERPTEGA